MQAKAVADLEEKYGYPLLEQAIFWAAKKGTSDLAAIETVIAKMADRATKPPSRAGPSPPNDTPKAFDTIHKTIERLKRGESYFGTDTS